MQLFPTRYKSITFKACRV